MDNLEKGVAYDKPLGQKKPRGSDAIKDSPQGQKPVGKSEDVKSDRGSFNFKC